MQKKYKKITFFSLLLIHYSGMLESRSVFNTDLGQARIVDIMHQGPGGLALAYKNIECAESLNLASDINLAVIADKFNCATIVGKSFLSDAFSRLISPKNKTFLLDDRQHAIYVISHNEALREKLHGLLRKAAEQEASIINFMQQKQNIIKKLPQGSYAHRCATSPFIQCLHQAQWAGVGAVGGYGLQKLYDNKDNLFADKPALLCTIESYMDKQILDPMQEQLATISRDLKMLKIMNRNSFSDPMMRHTYDKKLLDLEHSQSAFTEAIHSLESFKAELSEYSGHVHTFAYGMAATAATIVAYSVYQMYGTYVEGLEARNSLYAFNQLIVIAEDIETLCNQHGIKKQCTMSDVISAGDNTIVSQLKSYPYNNNYSLCVVSALTRTFIHQVYEKDLELAPVFAAIAEMDVLCSIADVVVDSQIQANKFCFVEFVAHKTPMITMEKFWNMLVPGAVSNDFDDSRNVILTGPNAGGKSTSIRAILQNILLAQTFGIAAATQCALTPFDVIHSFINVSDDILGGKSLFATEIQRAQDIMQRIQALLGDEKYFFALDELFTGTNAEDGEMCACSFIENIASYSNVQFIYATHFNRLKNLGNYHDHCVNYKINPPAQDNAGLFIRDANGKLIYPYTLSLGANNISVAREIAQDAGLLS